MDSDWSKLPVDLVTTIALKSESIEDFVYFSAVCRSWNRAWSSIKPMWRSTQGVPWLLLAENTDDNPDHVRKVFNPSNGKTYNFNLPDTFGGRCWGSPYGWIAVAKLDRTVQLFNPITNALINFPSFDILVNRHFGSRYNVSYSCWYFEGFLKKLIVLKMPSQKKGQEDEFAIMVSYDGGFHLAFARQGDESWTSLIESSEDESSEDEYVGILDVVAMDDHVCMLYEDDSSDYALACWNIKELISGDDLLKPTKKYLPCSDEVPRELHQFGTTVYLIQSGRDLLLAFRHLEYLTDPRNRHVNRVVNYQTKDFGVYSLNVEDNKWDRIEELGDMVLFVGCNSSMAVSVARDKCLQPNCIYFTDDQAKNWNRLKFKDKNGGHDMGVLDIKSKLKRPLYEGDDTRSKFCTPIWFIPQV